VAEYRTLTEQMPGFGGLVPGVRGLLDQVGRTLGKAKRSVQAATTPKTGYEDWLNAPVLPRNAADVGPTQDVYLQPGVGYFDRRSGRFIGPENKRTVVEGLDETGVVDRRKSDTYRQYAQTPEGQFQRYFQTPEMDQYFGAASRGKGAPSDLASMEALAGQKSAPTSAPLSSYYRAQSAAGRGNMDEIVSALGYKGTPMEQWAKANPMLAFRQFNKKFPAGEPTQGPTPAIPGIPTGEEGTAGQRALEGARYQLSGDSDNFATPANPIPPTEQPGPGGMTQGQRVDYFRGADNLKPQQAAFTSGGDMPAFQTTSEKAAEFLKRPGISTLF